MKGDKLISEPKDMKDSTEDNIIPRTDGYYWVRHKGKWEIAEWFNGQWCFLGDIGLMSDDHFDKIHEDPIEQPAL